MLNVLCHFGHHVYSYVTTVAEGFYWSQKFVRTKDVIVVIRYSIIWL